MIVISMPMPQKVRANDKYAITYTMIFKVQSRHGSYKQKLMEFKAFQGFSRPNIAIFEALSRMTILYQKIIFEYDFIYIPPCEQNSIIREYFFINFVKTLTRRSHNILKNEHFKPKNKFLRL